MYSQKWSIIMRKSSHFDKSISYLMNYVILKYSPSVKDFVVIGTEKTHFTGLKRFIP